MNNRIMQSLVMMLALGASLGIDTGMNKLFRQDPIPYNSLKLTNDILDDIAKNDYCSFINGVSKFGYMLYGYYTCNSGKHFAFSKGNQFYTLNVRGKYAIPRIIPRKRIATISTEIDI